jgi:hypothetical protein
MFDKLSIEKRNGLASFCCTSAHCHLNDEGGKTFFQFVHGTPLEDKVVVWLRLGRDEKFVCNPEPPSIEQAHWRVVEKLRY